jgi:hypothetical protein
MLDHGFNTAYSHFWEAIIETSKIHNLFIQYPNKYIFEYVGILLKMGRRSIKYFDILIIVTTLFILFSVVHTK